MTIRELKQVKKRIKAPGALCPICNDWIDFERVDPDSIEYVKSATRAIHVYHKKCVWEYMKGGKKSEN